MRNPLMNQTRAFQLAAPAGKMNLAMLVRFLVRPQLLIRV
jgi:hypothetical protein